MTDSDDSTSTDLSFVRVVDVPTAKVWAAWTEPEHLVHWFTPAPWTTEEAVVDPRPGGIFRTVMAGPDGERNEGNGCVLEVVPERRFVWTAALGPDYRPNDFSGGGFPFTAVIEMEPQDGGTRYTATVRHATAADAATHAEMGFADGWGAALDQLVAYMSGR